MRFLTFNYNIYITSIIFIILTFTHFKKVSYILYFISRSENIHNLNNKNNKILSKFVFFIVRNFFLK